MPKNLDDEKDQPKQPVSKEADLPLPAKTESKKSVSKADLEAGDSTARVSTHPQPGQPGPDEDSEGKSTDTRAAGSKKPGRKKDQELPHPETAADREQDRTAAEVAAGQPLRQSDLQAPTERVQVEGEPVTVVANPGRVDPEELKPSRADTIIKDNARAQGLAFAADAPVNRVLGGDILEGTPGETKFKEQKNGDLLIEGGIDG